MEGATWWNSSPARRLAEEFGYDVTVDGSRARVVGYVARHASRGLDVRRAPDANVLACLVGRVVGSEYDIAGAVTGSGQDLS